MEPDSKLISVQECTDEVRLMARRTALLFHFFAATLVQELGEEEGTRLIKKAIQGYGEYCGRAIRLELEKRGLPTSEENFNLIPDLPHYGWEKGVIQTGDGDVHATATYCPIAATFRELGPEAQVLGRLYCAVDQAKQQAYNPDEEFIHLKNVLDGDDYCEFLVRPSAKDEG